MAPPLVWLPLSPRNLLPSGPPQCSEFGAGCDAELRKKFAAQVTVLRGDLQKWASKQSKQVGSGATAPLLALFHPPATPACRSRPASPWLPPRCSLEPSHIFVQPLSVCLGSQRDLPRISPGVGHVWLPRGCRADVLRAPRPAGHKHRRLHRPAAQGGGRVGQHLVPWMVLQPAGTNSNGFIGQLHRVGTAQWWMGGRRAGIRNPTFAVPSLRLQLLRDRRAASMAILCLCRVVGCFIRRMSPKSDAGKGCAGLCVASLSGAEQGKCGGAWHRAAIRVCAYADAAAGCPSAAWHGNLVRLAICLQPPACLYSAS